MGEHDLPGTDGAGGLASLLAAAWKFVRTDESPDPGSGAGQAVRAGPPDQGIRHRGRAVDIEGEIDKVLQGQRADEARPTSTALDTALNVAAHRLENLIHERRVALAAQQYGKPTA